MYARKYLQVPSGAITCNKIVISLQTFWGTLSSCPGIGTACSSQIPFIIWLMTEWLQFGQAENSQAMWDTEQFPFSKTIRNYRPIFLSSKNDLTSSFQINNSPEHFSFQGRITGLQHLFRAMFKHTFSHLSLTFIC